MCSAAWAIAIFDVSKQMAAASRLSQPTNTRDERSEKPELQKPLTANLEASLLPENSGLLSIGSKARGFGVHLSTKPQHAL